MSDTPETDAEAMDVGMGHFMVDADFARKLERERDKAREELEMHAWDINPGMAQAKIDELNRAVERLERERDDLRDRLNDLLNRPALV